MMSPNEFAAIFDRHEAYWDDRRSEMRKLRHAYLMRFWDRENSAEDDLLIETARAYELVESFVASLFVRDPSVVIKPDIHGHGDAIAAGSRRARTSLPAPPLRAFARSHQAPQVPGRVRVRATSR